MTNKIKYERGVEVTASAVITNENNQVLLAESKKWKNLWLPPGGHVDPGESIFEAACREGKEEVGLQLKAIELINLGELKIDQRELSEARWFDIDEAIEVVTSGDTIENTLLLLKEKKFSNLDSKVYRD